MKPDRAALLRCTREHYQAHQPRVEAGEACPILLCLEMLGAVVALDLTQAEVHEITRLAERPDLDHDARGSTV